MIVVQWGDRPLVRLNGDNSYDHVLLPTCSSIMWLISNSYPTIICSLLSRQDGRTLLHLLLLLLACMKTKILVPASPMICFVLFSICIYKNLPPPIYFSSFYPMALHAVLYLIPLNTRILPTFTFTFVSIFLYFHCIYLAFNGHLWYLPSIHIRFALFYFAKRLTSIALHGPLRILSHRLTTRLVNPLSRLYRINYACGESV